MQDEAAELIGGVAAGGSAEKGLALLAEHCAIAAVTLGERGCLGQRRGEAPFAEPAAKDVRVADATGAPLLLCCAPYTLDILPLLCTLFI